MVDIFCFESGYEYLFNLSRIPAFREALAAGLIMFFTKEIHNMGLI